MLFQVQPLELKQWYTTDKETVEAELAKEQKVLKPVLAQRELSLICKKMRITGWQTTSNPLKHFLVLPNGVGIVDSDYYNNPDEGLLQLLNFEGYIR